MNSWKTIPCRLLILAVTALGPLPGWSQSPELLEVIVQGDNVNIRAKATNVAEVVTQKNFGDVLQAKRLDGDWVEIVPPADISVYVSGDFLHENTVKASTLNVRAGPSPNYNVVGQLKRNDVVERTGEKNGWIAIKPTLAMSMFVSRDFVKPKDPPPAPAPAVVHNPPPAPAPAPQPRPAVTRPRPATPPPPLVQRNVPREIKPVKPVQPVASAPRTIPMPKHLELLPVQGQGQPANRQGVIHSYLLTGSAPSKFYLTIDTGGGRQKVCYLDNSTGAIKAHKGKPVALSGWDFWVQGQKLPLMVVDTIQVQP